MNLKIADTPPYSDYRTENRPAERTLKQLIWLYFWLLLFEGALRKWVLPGLSTPLLIIRDPVALGIILIYVVNRYHFWNLYNLIIILTSSLSFVLAIGIGHGNFGVALFGFRIFAVHFPLIFIIGEIFDRDDVEKMGRVLMWIIIPITVLVAFQFYSPQSAWVNRGVGGDIDGAGFSGANGFFRPPGLFSFTSGNTLLYGLCAAFMFYFWQQRGKLQMLILILATVSIFVTIPLSISRGYLFQVIICFVFLGVASITDAKSLTRFFGILLILPLILLLTAQFEFVQTAIEAFTARFESAAISEGGLEGTLGERFFGGMLRAITDAENTPLFGYGLGMGTNVGSSLLTGRVSYLIAEGEWGRVIGETGLFLGLVNIIVRTQLGFKLLFRSFGELFKGQALPWMLISCGFLSTSNSLWGQPTALGFAVLSIGMVIAAFNEPMNNE